jgi:hypothetical protein
MTTAVTLDPRTQVERQNPGPPKQITIFVDRPTDLLFIKPQGTLEDAPRNEILAFMRAHPVYPARELVLTAVSICERYGWKLVDSGLSRPVAEGPAAGQRDLIAIMTKAAS